MLPLADGLEKKREITIKRVRLTYLLSASACVVDELVSVGLCIFHPRKVDRRLLEGTVQTTALEEYREVCPVLKIPIAVTIPCAYYEHGSMMEYELEQGVRSSILLWLILPLLSE